MGKTRHPGRPALRRLFRKNRRFAGGGDTFLTAGVPIARNVAVVEAGLDYALSPNATIGVTYAGQFASDIADQSARINLNVQF